MCSFSPFSFMGWEAGGGWTGLYSGRLGMVPNEAEVRDQARAEDGSDG